MPTPPADEHLEPEVRRELHQAQADGRLAATTYTNLVAFLALELEPWERASLDSLIGNSAWEELNDRFFRVLRMGTGGLRGRTVGRIVTEAERGTATGPRPEHPAVGSNCLNFRTVEIATRAFIKYLYGRNPALTPRIAVSFDSRHFSREFAVALANTAAAGGADVVLFSDPASTPQLAFSVREYDCHAGAMITASHNPSHDNGYKLFGRDSGQLVGRDADEISAAVTAALIDPRSIVHDHHAPGTITMLGAEADAAYLAALDSVVVDADAVRRAASSVSVVYSPLHGTGGRITIPALERMGITPIVVRAQATMDGSFPTVKSPNPEYPATMTMALETAVREGAAAAFASDPDGDRIGVAARRGSEPQLTLLTGNQLAALFADYRLGALFRAGILTADNARNAVVITTFVTTDLISRIAHRWGVRCVLTHTGFKHIGARMRLYSARVYGDAEAYRPLPIDVALARSSYVVLGCEESYGYLVGDMVRDKDGGAAAMMVAELLAAAANAGTDLLAQLDALYVRHGYLGNRLGTIVLEGSSGDARRGAILESFRKAPPTSIGGHAVTSVQDFERDTIIDDDGERVPPELMLRFHLGSMGHVTMRASGTEPILKLYFSVSRPVPDPSELDGIKAAVEAEITMLSEAMRTDALARGEAGVRR